MSERIILDTPLCLVGQAFAVCRAAHRNTTDCASEYWGLCVLLDSVSDKLDGLENTAPGAELSEDLFDVASNALGGAITLVRRTDDMVDDPLIMAVRTLLELAKERLDAEWQAFEQSSLEVQHG